MPLAILPGGTANVLAMEMKLGAQAGARGGAAGRIAAAAHFGGPPDLRRRAGLAPLPADGGDRPGRAHRLQGQSGLKGTTGKFAYWVAGWSLLGRRLAEFEVEIAGKRRRCSFALISKVRNYGGDFEIARNVTLLDDEFEVVLFEGAIFPGYVKYFAGMAVNRLEGMKGVTVMRADRSQCRAVRRPAGLRAGRWRVAGSCRRS